MSERVRIRGRRIACLAVLTGLVATVVLASAPSSASAACPETPGLFTTSWGGGSGHYNTDANWTNGAPTASCDASITAAGTYTVLMTGGSVAKSMTIGGAGSSPTLQISAEGANTNLNVAAGGQLSIASGAAIVLKCNVTPSSCGAPNIGAPTITNAGTITVDAAVNADADSTPFISGPLLNTGTMQFNHRAKFNNGAVTNQGTVNIADGTVLFSAGSHCADEGVSFKNDTGGTLNATGTGTFDVVNYEQGAGPTSGTNPVQVPCGSLKYTGNGTSKVKAYGGFTLTGTMQSNQSLTVSAEGAPNVNAILGGNFTNNGSITLTCTVACGASGGAGFNVNDKDFVNAGTFSVAAASGTGASVGANFEGTITNTGTMSFDQTAGLGGPVTNQGAINIADGKAVSSGGGCSGGNPVKNDVGGSINATGTGALFVGDYEQGNGTTTGTTPVQLYGGCLKYTSAAGVGASKVLVYAGFDLSGEMQPGQELTVTNNSANTNLRLVSPFTSKGSITFTCPSSPCNGPGFNGNGNLFTNAGTFTVAAAASSGTTLDMSSGGMTNAPTGTFQLNGHTNFNGGGALSNQGALRVVASANTPSFANTGTIVLDQSGTSPTLNTGTLSNTGTIRTSGASANTSSVNGTVDQTGASAQVIVPTGTKLSLNSPLLLKAGKLSGGGTLQGSVNNSGGTVSPGDSPGTLTVSGNYAQGAGGRLEVEIAGTGAGQFDQLAIGGSATLDGVLALQPTPAYVAAATPGDSVALLTYGGTRTGAFASTTATPPPTCQDAFGTAYDDAAKKVSFVVSASGAACADPDAQPPASTPTAPQGPPDTVLGAHPKAKVKTKKSKAQVKFTFSASVPGATFECKLDKGAYARCSSPTTYKVKPGKHAFSVRAIGSGETDATPAGFSFKVVKQKSKPKK